MMDLQRSSGLHSRALTDFWPPSHSCCTSRLSFPCLIPPCVHRPQSQSASWSCCKAPLNCFSWHRSGLRQSLSLCLLRGWYPFLIKAVQVLVRNQRLFWKQLFALWQPKPKELAAGQETGFRVAPNLSRSEAKNRGNREQGPTKTTCNHHFFKNKS